MWVTAREYRIEVVPKIINRSEKAALDRMVDFAVRLRALKPMTRFQRHNGNGYIGQWIAKESRHQRRKYISAHSLCDDEGNKEMQSKKRCKGRRHTCENPTGDAFRGIWQAINTMSDVISGARPTAFGVDKAKDDLTVRPLIPTLEDQV